MTNAYDSDLLFCFKNAFAVFAENACLFVDGVNGSSIDQTVNAEAGGMPGGAYNELCDV